MRFQRILHRYLLHHYRTYSLLILLTLFLFYLMKPWPSVSQVVLQSVNTNLPRNRCPYATPRPGITDLDQGPFWGDIPIIEEKDAVKCPRDRPFKLMTDDIMCLSLPPFLHNYKNPCWMSLERSAMQCLPYFQVIGVDKGGSTDLFSRIARHPDVIMNSGTLNKETQWWCWKRYGHMTIDGIRKEQFHHYLNYFKNASEVIPQHKNESGYHHMITGDGTPMDFWDLTGWKQIPQNYGLKEPLYTTPHLIHKINPNIKLVLIFRDPVIRVFSDYFFLELCEQSTEGFHASVSHSIDELLRCNNVNSLRSCLFNRTFHVNMKARIHLGFYAEFLKEWYKVFPKEQFLIFRTEDYAKDIAGHLKKAFKFLGLRDLPENQLNDIAAKTRKHVTKNKAKDSPMFNRTLTLLTELYRPQNRILAEMLQDNKFMWNY